MDEMINYVIQNGFAIAVAVYLLYQRATLDIKIVETLIKVSESIEHIEEAINRK